MQRDGGDVAIIGAGIVGLSIAFELAGRGAHVRVFDTGEPAMAASWAAAGMLAPITEAPPDEQMQSLCEWSLSLYPEYVEQLRAGSGLDPGLELRGIVRAAYTGAQEEILASRAVALAKRDRRCELLDRHEALLCEPGLGQNVRAALLVAGEGQVDNRRLGRALVAACESRGVRIERRVRELRLESDARRVLGLRYGGGFAPASCVVNAAGAWAGAVEGVPAESQAPVDPVKGQMLALAAPVDFVRHPIWLPGSYLVPRPDGRLLVGATAEPGAFDTRVTARGMRTLLDATLDFMPSLRDFTVTETWAGLRPATADEMPILGPTPTGGYFLATGHYRNGVLLAPATARLLADAIEGGELPMLSPFHLSRFGTDARRRWRSVPSPL